jgi:hypothetical protein
MLLAGGVLAASVVPAMAGGKPTTDPVPFPDGIVLPGGVFCDFDVEVTSTRNDEKVKTFPADADGSVRQITTGQLRIRATNLASGASVDLNISGPIHSRIAVDGTTTSVLLGRSVPVQPPGFIVSTGRVVQVTNPDGSSEILSKRGGSTDVCALLGS